MTSIAPIRNGIPARFAETASRMKPWHLPAKFLTSCLSHRAWFVAPNFPLRSNIGVRQARVKIPLISGSTGNRKTIRRFLPFLRYQHILDENLHFSKPHRHGLWKGCRCLSDFRKISGYWRVPQAGNHIKGACSRSIKAFWPLPFVRALEVCIQHTSSPIGCSQYFSVGIMTPT